MTASCKVTGPWNVLYVIGWDHELGEPLGGRCLAECTSADEALDVANRYAQVAAWEWWGDGWVAVTRPDHTLYASLPIVEHARVGLSFDLACSEASHS